MLNYVSQVQLKYCLVCFTEILKTHTQKLHCETRSLSMPVNAFGARSFFAENFQYLSNVIYLQYHCIEVFKSV